MIWIILATGFGANCIVLALLFRRVRINTRQLRDMRAERNSEWILHALQGVPEERERPARAAGGDSHTLPLHPQPARRKKHLGLFNGGAIAAALLTLSAIIRCAHQSHRAHIVSTALGTTVAAATTITVMTVTPWQQDIDVVPPTPAATATMSPSPDTGSPATPATDLRPPRDDTVARNRGAQPGASATLQGAASPTASPPPSATATSPAPAPTDVADPAEPSMPPVTATQTATVSALCAGAALTICLSLSG